MKKPQNYSQLLIHLVFAVKFRKCMLVEKHRLEIFTYMGGLIRQTEQKSIIINGTRDHVHILYGMKPTITISDTVYFVKRNSSIFINKQNWFPMKFAWQEGFGAFTCNRLNLDKIYRYIQNQEKHHQKQNFREEYLSFLRVNHLEFNEEFLFEFFD